MYFKTVIIQVYYDIKIERDMPSIQTNCEQFELELQVNQTKFEKCHENNNKVIPE